MILPTTLALTSALVFHSAGYRYCVDERIVAETGTVTASDIDRSGEAERVKWRGALVPFVPVRQLLGQPSREDLNGESVPVIIARTGEEGRRERNCERSASLWTLSASARKRWCAGLDATPRAGAASAARPSCQDGTVALVLDLPRLLEMNQADNL